MHALGPALRAKFRLEPGLDFLNHGSFGAAPLEVLEAAARWRERMEVSPDRFFREILPAALRQAASALAGFIGARAADVAFIENATAGVNAVLRSLRFSPGDEILASSQMYGAVRQAIRHVCDVSGARFVEAPIALPVWDEDALVAPFAERIGGRTRLVVVDHVASPTGLVFPVERITALARAKGAQVLVDGAHAPGQIALHVPALGADWYVGNCHKWLFAPRACAFLWAAETAQSGLHPLSISHDYGRGFPVEFDWTGTRDPSAWLAVTDALRFLEQAGIERVRAYNHGLVVQSAARIAAAWQSEADGPALLHGSMMAVRLPAQLVRGTTADRAGARELQSRLLAEHRIVVAVMAVGGALWARISAQIYNAAQDYEGLCALRA